MQLEVGDIVTIKENGILIWGIIRIVGKTKYKEYYYCMKFHDGQYVNLRFNKEEIMGSYTLYMKTCNLSKLVVM